MYGRTISGAGAWARGLESALEKWTKSDETRRKARNVTETKISRVLVDVGGVDLLLSLSSRQIDSSLSVDE